MPDHLEPVELAGFIDVGVPRHFGDATVLLESTGKPHVFFLRITASELLASSRVKRHPKRYRKRFDTPPPSC